MNEWSQKYILDQKYSTAQVRCVIWKCTLRPIFGLKVDQDFDFMYILYCAKFGNENIHVHAPLHMLVHYGHSIL